MNAPKRKARIRAWGVLLGSLALIGSFAFWIGPWIQPHIPIFDRMVTIAEEQDINMNAYFYTDIEASYDGANYLNESLKLEAPDQAGVTWPFAAGIILCIAILALGWRYLPMD